MLNWRNWRWILMGISAATALLLFGLGSIIGVDLGTNLMAGISVKALLAVANAVSFYALWKEL